MSLISSNFNSADFDTPGHVFCAGEWGGAASHPWIRPKFLHIFGPALRVARVGSRAQRIEDCAIRAHQSP